LLDAEHLYVVSVAPVEDVGHLITAGFDYVGKINGAEVFRNWK